MSPSNTRRNFTTLCICGVIIGVGISPGEACARSSSKAPDIGDVYIDSQAGEITVINETGKDLQVNVDSVDMGRGANTGDIMIKDRGTNITVIKKRGRDDSEINIGSVKRRK